MKLLSRDGQDIMRESDVTTTQEGIESYLRHCNGSSNVTRRMKIRTEYSSGQLKQQTTSFMKYILKSKVHINNVQLGGKEGIILGWIWKSLLNSRSPNRARAHTHRHVRAL
jgi:hypothetical protein